jgi:predicted aconitase with swiveling domain
VSAVFRGHVIVAGEAVGAAAVTTRPFNTLAALYDSVVGCRGRLVAEDPDDPALLGVDLAGRVLCAPGGAGSTSGGAMWEQIARDGIGPAAVLLSGPADPILAAGLALAAQWTPHPIPAVCELGDGFLAAVRSGDPVRVEADGAVVVGA